MSSANKLLNVRTLHPSLNERSECPGEGSVRSTGGEVIHREQRQQAVEPERTLHPSLNERSECPGEGSVR